MVHTYSDSKNIYSVDLMLAYITIFKPTDLIVQINISDYLSTLEYKGWGNPKKKTLYSPLDVINNPKKYSDEYDRINKAKLNYPIIIDKNNIIDGVHRLTKAYLLGKKNIKAYFFDKQLLKKFLINNMGDYDKIDNLTISDFIILFNRRFKCTKV